MSLALSPTNSPTRSPRASPPPRRRRFSLTRRTPASPMRRNSNQSQPASTGKRARASALSPHTAATAHALSPPKRAKAAALPGCFVVKKKPKKLLGSSSKCFVRLAGSALAFHADDKVRQVAVAVLLILVFV